MIPGCCEGLSDAAPPQSKGSESTVCVDMCDLRSFPCTLRARLYSANRDQTFAVDFIGQDSTCLDAISKQVVERSKHYHVPLSKAFNNRLVYGYSVPTGMSENQPSVLFRPKGKAHGLRKDPVNEDVAEPDATVNHTSPPPSVYLNSPPSFYHSYPVEDKIQLLKDQVAAVCVGAHVTMQSSGKTPSTMKRVKSSKCLPSSRPKGPKSNAENSMEAALYRRKFHPRDTDWESASNAAAICNSCTKCGGDMPSGISSACLCDCADCTCSPMDRQKSAARLSIRELQEKSMKEEQELLATVAAIDGKRKLRAEHLEALWAMRDQVRKEEEAQLKAQSQRVKPTTPTNPLVSSSSKSRTHVSAATSSLASRLVYSSPSYSDEMKTAHLRNDLLLELGAERYELSDPLVSMLLQSHQMQMGHKV